MAIRTLIRPIRRILPKRHVPVHRRRVMLIPQIVNTPQKLLNDDIIIRRAVRMLVRCVRARREHAAERGRQRRVLAAVMRVRDNKGRRRKRQRGCRK